MDRRESGRAAGYRGEARCGFGVKGQGRPVGAGGGGMPAAAGEGTDAYGYASALFKTGCEAIGGLLGAQVPDRVGGGRLDGFDRYGRESDQEGDQNGQRENPPFRSNVISEIVEPFVDGPPGERNGDEISDQHQLQEIEGQKPDEAGNGSAQHFADADLFD